MCASPASCWDSLAYIVAVHVPLPSLNPRSASCSPTLLFIRQLTTTEHTLHRTSTIPMYLYYPFPFGMRTIFDHAISSGIVPSLNITCTSRTARSHRLPSGSFSRQASLRHPFRSSALIPDRPPALPPFIPYTTSSTSAYVSMSLLTVFSCTNIGTLIVSGGRHM